MRITRIKNLEMSLSEELAAYYKDSKQFPAPEPSTQPLDLRPTKLPWLLRVTLGGNLHVALLTDRARLTYKQSYERLKMALTAAFGVLSLGLLLVGRAWLALEILPVLLLLFLYSCLSIREQILCHHGSRMPFWWVLHHHLCVLMALLLLGWTIQGHPTNTTLRKDVLTFGVYVALVQCLQYRYQMARLYTLRAVSRVPLMQMTTESASVHVANRHLLLLLPFVLVVHVRPSLALLG